MWLNVLTNVHILVHYINTGRFIMFSAITNIYNKKTKGPILMELFTATGKLKKFLLTTRDVRYVHHGWHGPHRYDIQVVATHASALSAEAIDLRRPYWILHPISCHTSEAVTTVFKYSWGWTQKASETYRVLLQLLINILPSYITLVFCMYLLTTTTDNEESRTRSVETQRGMAFGFRKTAADVIKPDG